MMKSQKVVIPVLARRSASARRRENGNPENSIYLKNTGFLLEFIPMKIGAGMTKNTLFGLFTNQFTLTFF